MQSIAQLVLAALVLGLGGVVVATVARALFGSNPAQARARRALADAVTVLGGRVQGGTGVLPDGRQVQLCFRPRHGRPAEACTWVGLGPAPRLETLPVVRVDRDGTLLPVDVTLPFPGQDAALAALAAAQLPPPVRLAFAEGRLVGLLLTGWTADPDVLARAVATARAL